MFTGIVDHCGRVEKITPRGIHLSTLFSDLKEGESISVDGICLTVVSPKGNSFYCEVSQETLDRTTLLNYQCGRKINLERAMAASDRFGGHWVSGHVDQTATVSKSEGNSPFVKLFFTGIVQHNMRYLIPKGSISLNGVSLTLNEIWDDGFGVMLIPHTLERTNLNELIVGDKVNVEFDWMVKVIVSQVSAHLKEGIK